MLGVLIKINIQKITVFAIILIIFITTSYSYKNIASENVTSLENDTYFLLGMLEEYISRTIYKDSDCIEGFYWGEKLHAYVIVAYLSRLMKEMDISNDIEIRRRQDLLVILHSKSMSEYLNSFFDDHPEDWKGFYRTNKDYRAVYLPYSIFDNVNRSAKLAYLAGAYYRFGRDNRISLANGKKKADLISRLLENVECPTPKRTHSAIGAAPVVHYVDFQPTNELKQWFQKYPEDWAIEAADTLFGLASDDELKIYRALITSLQNEKIDGYTLTVPCIVSRITCIRGDGAREMDGLSPEWQLILDDFNRRRTEYISLINLSSDSIIVDHDFRNKTKYSRIGFLRIGFNENKDRSLTFISSKGKIFSIFFKLEGENWKISHYKVDTNWRKRKK